MRFLIYILLAYIAYRIIKSLLRPRDEVSPGDVIDEMVKCASCETYIPRREGITKSAGGEVRNFCSERCAREYLEQKAQRKPG